jgi:2-oxoglutarate ferredoxin oxidoreductase subunit alpha
VSKLPRIDPGFRTDPANFHAYQRDPNTLARPWVKPGTPGLEHRVGGLEKDALTGNISYDANNHELMCRTRAEKVQRIAQQFGPSEIFGDPDGEVLVIAWGSTYGSITQAVIEARAQGIRCGHMHLRHLWPLPPDLMSIARRYKKVLLPEMNLGQLRLHLRGQLGLETVGLNKIQGKPFFVSEIRAAIENLARKPAASATQAEASA